MVEFSRLGMDWLSSNLVFIGCEEKLIIIPSSGATPKDVLTTILEGTVGMVNFLLRMKSQFSWCLPRNLAII